MSPTNPEPRTHRAVRLASLWLVAAAAGTAGAAEIPALPVITEPSAVWSLPTAQKSLEHPLRLEGRVSYFDPGFRMMWLEQNNVGTYVQLSDSAPAITAGQYVVIEGAIVPNNGLEARLATVRVLREVDPIKPLEVGGRLDELDVFQSRIIRADAYVDSQQRVDPQHLRLGLIIDGRPVIGWYLSDVPEQFPDLQGKRVRITGLFSGRYDPTRTRSTIEFWIAHPRQLAVLGDIGSHPGFSLPLTPIEQIPRLALGAPVRVKGVVDARVAGSHLVLHGDDGQIVVRSLQQQPVPLGGWIEAVGQVARDRGQWTVNAALFRPAGGEEGGPGGGALTTVAAIRRLSAEEASRGLPVEITGMTSWSLPVADFMFLQDVTGGIRVRYDRAQTGVIPYGKFFRIQGVTASGRFAPEVVLKDFTDLGSMSHPDPLPVSFEQAITGREDGQWVEMRGFLREVTAEGDWRWIHVTTPGGEFVGHLQTPVKFVANPGALIRVQGVCETNEDAEGRITGVTLRVPFVHDIRVEEDAPPNPFDLPRRTLQGLDRLSDGRSLMRIRVEGVVLHSEPGRLAFLQEKDTGLLVIGRETPALNPGDQVEAVGILGREGVRPVLREAVFRRRGAGRAPAPHAIGDPVRLLPAFDARLVRIQGTLLDRSSRQDRTTLILQHPKTGSIFEAKLDGQIGEAGGRAVQPGAELEVTGIYRLNFDDASQSRDFQLQLRSAADIAVIKPAQLWTVARALTVAGVLAGATALGLAWIVSLRRRVARQTEQIRTQLEERARLEAEVQRAARLEALGTLAGGIAHDFNNALTGIMGNLSLLRLELPPAPAAEKLLEQMNLAARRAKALTQQLLTFARGGEPVRTSESLPEIVRGAVESATTGTGTTVEYSFPADPWPGRVDKAQVLEAIRNLALYSVQSMSARGRLKVALANVDLLEAPPILPANRYLRLTLEDSGPGIEADQLPRLFDPYFATTKGANNLGLATAYSIIRKHEGHLQADSVPGWGAVFTLWLPVAEAAPAPEPDRPPAATPASPGARPLVLLMDDEEMIRSLGQRVLQRIGCETLLAADGADALNKFQAARHAHRPVALVILDLTVPDGMGGRETIEAIRKIDPHVPAIVSSGYSDDPVMANHRKYGFDAIVPKPYDVGEMIATIQRLVPAAGAGGS